MYCPCLNSNSNNLNNNITKMEEFEQMKLLHSEVLSSCSEILDCTLKFGNIHQTREIS